jgi:hypothetical protein
LKKFFLYLQRNVSIINSINYGDKTFFYHLEQEKVTVEALFREMPDVVISYSAIEELSYLL